MAESGFAQEQFVFVWWYFGTQLTSVFLTNVRFAPTAVIPQGRWRQESTMPVRSSARSLQLRPNPIAVLTYILIPPPKFIFDSSSNLQASTGCRRCIRFAITPKRTDCCHMASMLSIWCRATPIISALPNIAAAEWSKNRHLRDFWRRSMFAFFDSIDPKGDIARIRPPLNNHPVSAKLSDPPFRFVRLQAD
jgi:hypothetical protein